MKIGFHLLFWLMALLIEIFLVAVMSTPDKVEARVLGEIERARQVYGAPATGQLVTRVNSFFEAHLQQPMVRSENKLLVHHDPEQPTLLPEGVSRKTNSILIVFWMTAYQMVWRLSVMALWIWPISFLLLATCFDGYSQWRCKYYNFSYSNPVIYNTTLHWLIAWFFLPFFCLALPLQLSPLFLPVWALLAIWPIMLLLSNFQKMLD